MDPVTTQYAVYAGLIVAGWLFRHWFPGIAPAGSSPAPTPAPAPILTPALPVIPALPTNGIQIGHGELLNLIIAALQQSLQAVNPPPATAAAVVVKTTP